MSRKDKAQELFSEGYNCAQSVVLAFEDLINIDRSTLAKAASSFGGGMGGLREVCGTVSGMFMAAGFLYGFDENDLRDGKRTHYARLQELAGEFKELNGSIVCRTLLGLDRPADGAEKPVKKHSCKELVGIAAELLEKYIEEHPL